MLPNENVVRAQGTAPGYYLAAVLLGSSAYLYINLFAGLRTPFLLGGDQVLFWANAQRLLHGELIYRDFLEFTPPGTDLLYLGAFTLLGSRIWIPNLIVLLLGVILCWLCFYIARSIMKPAQAALAAALVMVLDYGKMINGTHHWFSVLAVMGALAVLLKATTPARIVIAGTLLGAASFFTQTRGAIAALGVAGFLIWDRLQTQTKESDATHIKRLLLLFLPLAAAWLALSSYFIAKVGFWQLWYFQVTYVLRYVASSSDPIVGSPGILALLRTRDGFEYLLVYCALPIIYAASLWTCRKGSRDASRADVKGIVLLTLVGSMMFLEVAQSPNSIRLYCVATPGIILFVRLLAVGLTSPARRYAAVMIWTGLILVAAHQSWSRHLQQAMVLDLPAGRVATTPITGGKLAWLTRHTTPGQFLFEARWVDVYLPLALRNPVFTDMLEGGHKSRDEFVDLSIRQLEAQRVQYIIWSPRLESPAYPFAKFHEFLIERYRRVLAFPDQDEVWELKSLPESARLNESSQCRPMPSVSTTAAQLHKWPAVHVTRVWRIQQFDAD
jgi:hypothetical protein